MAFLQQQHQHHQSRFPQDRSRGGANIPIVLLPPVCSLSSPLSAPSGCQPSPIASAQRSHRRHCTSVRQLALSSSLQPKAFSQQESNSTSGVESLSEDSAGNDLMFSIGSAPTWVDELDEEQRQALAEKWGFKSLPTSLPSGINPEVLLRALPDEVFEPDLGKALQGFIAPTLAMAAGFAWLWYMHSIIPLWQQLLCWLSIGTGYMGLFTIAQECARGTFLPGFPVTQDVVGSLIMAPSLFSLEAWRVAAFCHIQRVNQLGTDRVGSWHPITLRAVAAASPLPRLIMRLLTSTPLKALASIGGWLQMMQAWDLKKYYPGLRGAVLASWAPPIAFLGLGLPLLLACGGWATFLDCWLAPWLVFHAWLSLFSLLRHTAPHIPWRRFGSAPHSYDHARSIVSGTVTLQLPKWLEVLLNYPNYPLPQLLRWGAIPSYHCKAATAALREKLWPHMAEVELSWKLLSNHLSQWQVYDEEGEKYLTWDEAGRVMVERKRQRSSQRKQTIETGRGVESEEDGSGEVAVLASVGEGSL